MASVSGLALAGQDALMLHQPHQARDYDAPGDKYIRVIPFDTPRFSKNNTVQLEALEMVVDEAWVEIRLPKLSATAGLASYVPVPTMISDNGVQLFFNGQSVYTMSEAEALIYPFANTENMPQMLRRLDAGNIYPNDKLTALAPANRATLKNSAPAGEALYYMDLRPLLKILKHCGPLSAYAANKWKITVGLLPSTFCGQSSADVASVVSGNSEAISSMNLVLSGHREDAQNTARISQALATDGIKLSFTQSNHYRYALQTGSGNTAYAITSLEGEATDIWIMNRVEAGLNGTIAAAEAVNHMQWENFPNFNDTVAVGTQSNPTRVNGQYLPWQTIKMLQQGAAYNGGPLYVTQPGQTALGAQNTATIQDMSVLLMPLAEAASDGQLYGTYSGSIRLKNDFVVNFQMGTGAVAKQTVDIVVYIRRNMVLTHLGVVMMNE
jgi:hypothetical protein